MSSCGSKFQILNYEGLLKSKFDNRLLGHESDKVNRIPVLINYSIGKKKYEKKPDKFDLEILQKIQEMEIPSWFPTIDMLEKGTNGETLEAVINRFIHVHHFYYKTKSLDIFTILGND